MLFIGVLNVIKMLLEKAVNLISLGHVLEILSYLYQTLFSSDELFLGGHYQLPPVLLITVNNPEGI